MLINPDQAVLDALLENFNALFTPHVTPGVEYQRGTPWCDGCRQRPNALAVDKALELLGQPHEGCTMGEGGAPGTWRQDEFHVFREVGSGDVYVAKDKEHALSMWCADTGRERTDATLQELPDDSPFTVREEGGSSVEMLCLRWAAESPPGLIAGESW